MYHKQTMLGKKDLKTLPSSNVSFYPFPEPEIYALIPTLQVRKLRFRILDNLSNSIQLAMSRK